MIWTPEELAILRRPITAAEMEELMPHRSNLSIRLRRRLLARAEGFTPVNPDPDYAALGRLAGAKLRAQEIEHKAQFILAVARGALPSYTDVVCRGAYQRWRKTDPSFLAWFDSFKAERSAARQRIRAQARAAIMAERAVARAAVRTTKRRAVDRATTARAVPMGESHARSIMRCDVFKVASAAIGRMYQDARDSAISAMVLDLLDGSLLPEDAARHAAKYRAAARAEISFMPLKDRHEEAYSFSEWRDAA